jgi:predicted nucleotidyltransferase component of viral defense system
MIQPKEINAFAGKAGVKDTQIEKDYVISWVLYGIAKNTFLKENLVFKGGTVLKKVYFTDYRFSEDLDFTFKGDFNIDAIKAAFTELIKSVYDASRITLALKDETQHETGNFNFYISYTGPMGGGGAGKDIKVDICKDELIHNEPEERKIINEYSDLANETYGILCYSLDEIAAEKMRSLMQRTMPRDVYDLWYLFEMDGYDIEDCIFTFQEKAKFKKLDPKDFSKVIEKKEGTFAKHWKDHLAHQMTSIPDFNKAWRELGKHWKRFEKFIE